MVKLIAAFERGGSASQISLFLRLMQKKVYKKEQMSILFFILFFPYQKILNFNAKMRLIYTFFGLSSNIHLERTHELNFLIKLYTVRSG